MARWTVGPWPAGQSAREICRAHNYVQVEVNNMENGERKRIVVGIDGSSGSQRAIAWAMDMARTLRGEVVGVHVFQIEPYGFGAAGMGYGPVAIDYDAWRDEVRTQFESWCKDYRGRDVPFRAVLREGNPA